MRIITWNCCGGFLGKAERIAELRPDIAALQEVEPISEAGEFPEGARPTYWHRTSPVSPPKRKAIGMCSFTDIKLTPVGMTYGIRQYRAERGSLVFHVMAAWTSTTTRPGHRNYRQLHEALVEQDTWVRARPTVVLGDLNQSIKCRGWKPLMKLIEPLGLVSAYHRKTGEEYGAETRPTHFHRKKQESEFHIDYCFLLGEWAQHITRVEVGEYGEWTGASDHVPLIVDLDLESAVAPS